MSLCACQRRLNWLNVQKNDKRIWQCCCEAAQRFLWWNKPPHKAAMNQTWRHERLYNVAHGKWTPKNIRTFTVIYFPYSMLLDLCTRSQLSTTSHLFCSLATGVGSTFAKLTPIFRGFARSFKPGSACASEEDQPLNGCRAEPLTKQG